MDRKFEVGKWGKKKKKRKGNTLPNG